jgi:hypothetical protein
MGKELITKCIIDAPPSKVWQVLMDFPSYKDWNTFLVKIEGTPKVGEQLEIHFYNGMVFKPKVLVSDEAKEFRWLGKLGCGYLFDGEHRFILTPLENGTKTELEHAEYFTGMLVTLLPSLLKETQANFEKMNKGISERVALIQ